MSKQNFIDTEAIPGYLCGWLYAVQPSPIASATGSSVSKSNVVVPATGVSVTGGVKGDFNTTNTTFFIKSSAFDSLPATAQNTSSFDPIAASPSVGAPQQPLGNNVLGVLDPSNGGVPTKWRDLVDARIDGTVANFNFFVRQIDGPTYDAVLASTTNAQAVSALQNFQYMEIDMEGQSPTLPGPNKDNYLTPVANGGNLTLSLTFKLPNGNSTFNFLWQGGYWGKEVETIPAPWAKELELAGYPAFIKELETIPAAWAKELELAPYPPFIKELEATSPAWAKELEVFHDDDLSNNLSAATASDDCGTVSVQLANYTPNVGETFTATVSRYGLQSTITPTSATAWDFETTQDGVYNVIIYSNQSGVIANRYYFHDCRTLKCISRIAKEDTDAAMEGGCDFNEDWKLIYGLWYGAKFSFQVGNYANTEDAFEALKRHCKECNEARCGCD